ncbi:Peptidase C13, legumain, partial [Candidatus Magnetomorum sp. HK-1]
MSPCTSEAIDINVVETAGYAIIVQGKIKNNEGLRAHNKTTQFVYNQLKNRGFFVDEETNNDDIYYLNYDIEQSGVDSIPTKEAVKASVTEWAKEKMDQKPANLYIIMVDHGLADEFLIYPEIITSADLAQWLYTLQTSFVNEDAKKQEIVVILGFCRSGSFIDELSGNHRVIITSASKNESSYKGPKELDSLGNILRDGEYFITELFKKISFGQSIKEAFEKAVLLTELYTRFTSGTPNSPFFDKSLQHPLIDDNGDKQGSNILSDPKGDGAVSENLYIGVSALTKNDPGDVSIIDVSDAIFLQENESSVDEMWARVDDYSRLGTIWVEIKAPDYTTINPVVSGQAEMDLIKEVYDRLDTSDFSSKRFKWEDLTGFETPGTYQVFYFAIDDITKHVSPLVETLVYKAK